MLLIHIKGTWLRFEINLILAFLIISLVLGPLLSTLLCGCCNKSDIQVVSDDNDEVI